MKKIMTIVLVIIMTIISCCLMAVYAQQVIEPAKVVLDDKEIEFPDAQPFVDVRNRTLVPIRFVSEAIGAKVDWEDETETVKIVKGNDTVRYTIGEMKAYLNEEVHVFDTYGFLKEDRTYVPLRFISEMLGCDVEWVDETNTVIVTLPGDTVKFPDPKLTVHYPESESDKRLFWITLDNYAEFKRECPYYEFKIEFLTPTGFNNFEQDEGAINGWQKYNRNQFVFLTNEGNTVVSVSRAFYTTRDMAKTFKPVDGDALNFKLTVHRKCSDETREYTFSEVLKMPYSLINMEV